MIINLDDNFRLTADKYQWIMQKKRMRKNKDTGDESVDWKSISYHATPTQAINFHADRLLRASDCTGVTEALAECNRITTALTDALTPHFEVKE
jgi:orotate phosphoribosyltransferase-like protein